MRNRTWPYVLVLFFTLINGRSVHAACELSFLHRDSSYNFSLTRPIPKYPHGILSEDGFYKVSRNGTLLWFQLCDQMVFNHDPPRCFGCEGCGTPSHCGMVCSALVANDIGGYSVCTAAGKASNPDITVIDKDNPEKGVTVKMSAMHSKRNCSLSVSIFCDSSGLLGPDLLERSGLCDYVTSLRHPSGCPKVISVHGGGWGWFGTLITILVCIFVGYLLVGAVYRYFFLGIRGPDVVPNLQFWLSLPQKSKNFLISLSRRFRREPRGNRSSYTQTTF